MKLLFSYNLEKDAENFLVATKSMNNPRPTKFQSLYQEKFGKDFEIIKVREFIESYIKENNINFEERRKAIEDEWLPVENIFVKRIEEIFGIQYPAKDIKVFLTTSDRCSYNTKAGYFFVDMQSKNTNAIIMHELLHFYTWQVFFEELKQKGLSGLQYNDIKESLTELLNLEFSDLMGGGVDKGYDQHQEMRKKIRELWSEDKNIKVLVSNLY